MYDNGTYRDMTREEEAEHVKANNIGEEVALTRYANTLTGANDPDLISAAETLITDRIKEE
jgi:hypothetical protein